MMRSLVFVALTFVAGCSCATAPTTPTCHSNAECSGGQVCIDSHCGAPVDASIDARTLLADTNAMDTAITPRDAPIIDANCVPITCAATDACADGVDGDCDGIIDEGCNCVPGSTSRCLPGRPDPSTPRCSWGQMTCSGASEFGAWGTCTGGTADGGASLYGCRRIGIMGAPGANTSSNFQAWLQTQGAIVARFQDTATAPTLHIEELRTFDLVVIDWLQRAYTMAEADTLTQWVNEGGALFAMTGHDSGGTAARQVSLLATLGPNYDLRSCGTCDPMEVCDNGHCVLNGPATLLSHPTTLAADGVTMLPPVSFFGGLRVTVPASMSASFVPMGMIGSYVVGAAGSIGRGHALLWGDEWIEFDSQWSTMPPIPQFWKDSVRWLSPDPAIVAACPGDF